MQNIFSYARTAEKECKEKLIPVSCTQKEASVGQERIHHAAETPKHKL